MIAQAAANVNFAATKCDILSGAVEVATEKLTGGIPGLNAGWLDDLVDKQISKLASNSLGKFLVKQGANALGEGFEKYLSEVAGAYLVKMYDTEAAKENGWETLENVQGDAMYAALLGALTSIVLNSPNYNAQGVSDYTKSLEATQAYNAAVDALAEAGGMTVDEAKTVVDGEIADVAESMQAKAKETPVEQSPVADNAPIAEQALRQIVAPESGVAAQTSTDNNAPIAAQALRQIVAPTDNATAQMGG